MKLSILIATLPQRHKSLGELLGTLSLQKKDEVEVLYLGDFKSLSVGAKRNALKRLAQGEYITFVDDDDRISADYVESLLEAIKTGVDVVTFGVTINRYKIGSNLVRYGIGYGHTEICGEFFRVPNHLMCIKRSLANLVDFEEVNQLEDTLYANAMIKHLKTEHKIEKVLYIYESDPRTSQTLPCETRKQILKDLASSTNNK